MLLLKDLKSLFDLFVISILVKIEEFSDFPVTNIWYLSVVAFAS